MSPSYIPTIPRNAARWLRFAGLVVAVALLLWLAYQLRGVLTPILAALAMAYVLNPLVTWMERRKVQRMYSVVAIYVIGTLALVTAAALLAETAIAQTGGLIEWGYKMAAQALEWTRAKAPNLLSTSQPVKLLQERGVAVAGSVFAFIVAIFSNTAYWLSLTILFPMYSFFFLLRFNDIARTIRDHLPELWRDGIVRVVSTIDRSMAGFFRGRLILCAAVGSITAIGWLIADVPYAIPLGILVGVLNLVPFMAVLGLPPAILLTIFGGEPGEPWFWPVIGALIVFMLVQALDAFVLGPYIMFHSAGLHPITTVIVLLIGAELAGIFGMLLAIPIASTLKSLGAEFVLPEIRRLAGMNQSAAATAAPAPASAAGPAAEKPAESERV